MPLDPTNFLSYKTWLSLPQETRSKLQKMFGISFSVPRHVVDSTVISDGVDPKSLAVITKEKMQEITGEKSDDFYFLFQALVNKVEAPEVEAPKTEETPNVQQEKPTEVKRARPLKKATRGRPKKGAK